MVSVRATSGMRRLGVLVRLVFLGSAARFVGADPDLGSFPGSVTVDSDDRSVWPRFGVVFREDVDDSRPHGKPP